MLSESEKLKIETDLRAAIVEEARSWIDTPYKLGANLKGVGIDCATFIYAVMVNAHIIEEETIGIFSHDWFCHVTEEVYLRRVVRHAYKLVEGKTYISLEAKPGCICMIRTANSRVYNHGAIVTKWPMIVHAMPPSVNQVDASRYPHLAHQHVIIFDPVAKILAEKYS